MRILLSCIVNYYFVKIIFKIISNCFVYITVIIERKNFIDRDYEYKVTRIMVSTGSTC